MRFRFLGFEFWSQRTVSGSYSIEIQPKIYPRLSVARPDEWKGEPSEEGGYLKVMSLKLDQRHVPKSALGSDPSGSGAPNRHPDRETRWLGNERVTLRKRSNTFTTVWTH